ncbi:MAG TPA: hypothetical protein VLE89_06825 [Chlamydiales bacterium]|nr:hypothetical protein [Chlamydiales bacterium]
MSAANIVAAPPFILPAPQNDNGVNDFAWGVVNLTSAGVLWGFSTFVPDFKSQAAFLAAGAVPFYKGCHYFKNLGTNAVNLVKKQVQDAYKKAIATAPKHQMAIAAATVGFGISSITALPLGTTVFAGYLLGYVAGDTLINQAAPTAQLPAGNQFILPAQPQQPFSQFAFPNLEAAIPQPRNSRSVNFALAGESANTISLDSQIAFSMEVNGQNLTFYNIWSAFYALLYSGYAPHFAGKSLADANKMRTMLPPKTEDANFANALVQAIGRALLASDDLRVYVNGLNSDPKIAKAASRYGIGCLPIVLKTLRDYFDRGEVNIALATGQATAVLHGLPEFH